MSLLSTIGITDATAQTAVPSVSQSTTATTAAEPANAAHPAGAGFSSMIWMLVIFIAFFYFLMIRPQSKRAKEHRKLLDSLGKGDEVVTTSGMVGKIVEVGDDFTILNVADNTNVTFQKGAITTILPKGTLKNISN